MNTESAKDVYDKTWVLVVEDDPDLRQTIEEELARRNHSFVSCSTAQEAFRLLSNQKFDCIVLDMRLQKGAGDEVVLQLRSETRGYNYQTPVVVTSGELNAEIVNRIRTKVSAFYVKPFNLDTVFGKIDSLCRK